MSVYNIDEAAFELPGVWDDKTVTILSAPAPDGSNFGLVITRMKLGEGQPLGAFVDDYLAQHSRQLRGFELLGVRESAIGGQPAIEAKLTWINDNKVIFHHLAFAVYYGVVVVFTGSALVKYAESVEQFLGELLPTLRFRERSL